MTHGRPLFAGTAFTLVLAVALSGCVPGWPTRNRVTPPPTHGAGAQRPSPLLETARVEARIQHLEALLAGDDVLNDAQRLEARKLADDYRRILQGLRDPERGGQTAAILFEGLGRLEERYFRAGRTAAGTADPVVSLLARKRERIRNAYVSGDYETVVQSCMDLETDYGADALTPETGLLFAVALAEQGKTREAIRVGERILPSLEGRPGLVHLRGRMVAWYQKTGNPHRAQTHYEKLVDHVMERENLLARAEKELSAGSSRSRPEATLPPVSPPPAEASAGSGPLGDLLHRVDVLIQEKAFDEARILLIRQRIRSPEGPETAAIDRAMDRVDRAEAEEQARSSASAGLPPDPEDDLAEVRRLVEAEDFEGALSRLDRLDGAPGGDRPEVSTLRERVATQLVRSEREKAARLYLRARNARTPEEKATHLRTSHRILKGLLDRFPETSMAPKIRSNLDTVEEEMERIGVSPDSGGGLEE